MSEENVEVLRAVRTPVSVSTKQRRRTVDERIFVRFPALVRVLFSAWSRLPPQSRPRRAWLSRTVRQACEAWNRRDFDLLFLGIDPQAEYRLPESLAGGYMPPDLLGVHQGYEGYLCVWEGLFEAWENLELKLDEAIDFGDRLLLAGRATGHGRHSGAPIDAPLFQVITMRRGLVIRQEEFGDRDRALQAAGLRE
jgi:ketosteroid isomerase-like protein